MDLPEVQPTPDTESEDLFNPRQRRSDDQPSEGVYADVGQEELKYIGEIQLPSPMPVEIIVQIGGFDYIFKLSERVKSA